MIFGTRTPPIPNLREDFDGKFHLPGLIRGLFCIGKPGSGKTRYVAGLIVSYALTYPDQGAVILDASGALCNDILAIIMMLPKDEREKVEKRLVVDILNHPEYTQTLPEFHRDYKTPLETQLQRAAENLRRLNPQTMELGMLGKPALEETAPELFRVLVSLENEHGENWQITEAKKLLLDGSQRAIALAKVVNKVPESVLYFRSFFSSTVDAKEREMRSFTLRSILGVVEPRFMRARLGYYKPSWSPNEAVEKGLIVLVTGETMLDQEMQLNYIFTQIFSMIRQEMNRRRPNNPDDKPFLLAIDEAPILFEVPGMTKEFGQVSTFYRSRKVWFIVIVQALWQIAKEMREQIWSFGNIISFAVQDVNDARQIAEQIFHYNPKQVKQPPRTIAQNPTTEPEHGEYTLFAQWIQGFKKREMVVRRYFDESAEDRWTRHIEKNADIPANESIIEVDAYKERIFLQRAIPIRDALEVVNHRNLVPPPTERNTA
jgi:hypothetical protein